MAPARAAELLGVARPTISGWLATLTDGGLVERGAVDGDARRVLVVPSAEGRRIWKAASEAVRRAQLRLLARAIDPNAQADLVQTLARIADELPGNQPDS